MSATLAPVAVQQHSDADGRPYAGGLLYTYIARTSTPTPTWIDKDQTTLNTNPIELDAAGRCVIFLASTVVYKFVLKTPLGATVWTQDDVAPTTLGQETLGAVFAFLGDQNSPITDLAYPSGATFAQLHAGSVIYEVDTSTLVGTYQIKGMLMASAGESVSAVLVNLSDGAPDTPMASMSTNNNVGTIVSSGNITFPPGGVTKRYGIKVRVSGGTGFVWGVTLSRVS